MDTLRVHTAASTQIGTIPIRSKKWCETISEYFPQSVNNMKRNKEVRKVKVFQQKLYFFFCPIKIIFLSAILIILGIVAICFPCS